MPRWARQVLNLRPLACEASALPLSYAPGPGSVASALRPPARARAGQKETAARARVAPPSIGRARSSDVRWALCTALSFRRKTQYGATSVGRPAVSERPRRGGRGLGRRIRGMDHSPPPGGVRGAMMRMWNRAPTTPRGGPISPRNGRCSRGGVRGWRRSPSPSASAASCRRCSNGQGAFIALGVAYAFLGLGLVLFGSLRERAQAKALAEGGFAPLSRALVAALTAYLALLGLATIALVLSV